MYESPIEVLYGQMQTEIENDLLVKCSQSVGYNIDKDELIKALKYEREQYKNGYSEGLNADKWISVKERLPEENQKCLVYRDINADLKITTGIWHSDWKEFYGLRHGTRLEDTIAWMPLPEPPKEA